jgi:uncharacterized protein YndB with AHSA1/START domain
MTDPITVETRIEVPPEAACEAFTSPHAITPRNVASPDRRCPHAEVDFHKGDRHVARMKARDGSIGLDYAVTYTGVAPPGAVLLRLDDGRQAHAAFEAEDGLTSVRTGLDANRS